MYSVYYVLFVLCTRLDALHSMYLTLIYFTLCTMHLTRCTSLDVLHADLFHSVYYALDTIDVCTWSYVSL